MGQLFSQGGLTTPNSALMNQSQGGQASFIGSPSQVLSKANAGLPSAESMMGPDVLNPSQKAPKLPFIGQPNFQQAATAGAPPGGVNALSPGLSKLGKLGVLLTQGVQGALAGRAAEEQAAVQSGGRRSGGIGMAMEAGYNLPFLRSLQQQKVQQGQAETAETQAKTGQTQAQTKLLGESVPVTLPNGQQILIPSNQLGQYTRGLAGAQVTADSRETVAQTGAEAKENVAQTNKRFMSVPGVGVLDTQAPSGKPSLIPDTGQGLTLSQEHINDFGLPQEMLGQHMTSNQLADWQKMRLSAAPTVKSSTDPLGLTTTSTTTKQLPGAAGTGVPARPMTPRPVNRPAVSGGGAPGAGGGSSLDNMAQQLVERQMDPSQVPRRSAAYSLVLQKANAYSQQKYGEPFDIAGATSDYQYAKNPQTQNTLKMINAMTDKGGSIEIAQKAAAKLPQMNSQTLNKVFNAAATEFGSPSATNFHTAMLGLADEYSKVMGGGVSSDTGRQQGLDLLKNAYSKGQLSGAIGIMQQDIAARKSALVGSNRYLMKQYAQPKAQSAGKVLVEGVDF
jgi:hypothetical protein